MNFHYDLAAEAAKSVPCGFYRSRLDYPKSGPILHQAQKGSPNLWTCAYLAAFAHAAQLTLVTFDVKIPASSVSRCLVLG